MQAPAEQRGPIQFWCFWQSAQLQLVVQAPQVGAPQMLPSVLRTHAVASFSVDVPVLQLLAPHVYVVSVRDRLPALPQRLG